MGAALVSPPSTRARVAIGEMALIDIALTAFANAMRNPTRAS
jgi:hypothetical protein